MDETDHKSIDALLATKETIEGKSPREILLMALERTIEESQLHDDLHGMRVGDRNKTFDPTSIDD